MSYNIAGASQTADGLVESLKNAAPDNLSPDSARQLAEAIKAVKAIADSGVVGSLFSVSITGHANPGHKPTPGWANDCLVINIQNQESQ